MKCCPKCGFTTIKDLSKYTCLELSTMLGDLMDLKELKEIREWDQSHYYDGLGSSMTKSTLMIMIRRMEYINKQLKALKLIGISPKKKK